jgi:hypothetical protein
MPEAEQVLDRDNAIERCLGKPHREVRRRASRSKMRHPTVVERTRMQALRGIFALFLDGNVEASLLLVDSLWDESLAKYAPNACVAAVPSHHVLRVHHGNCRRYR